MVELSLTTARTNIFWSFVYTFMGLLYTVTTVKSKRSSFSQNIFMLNIFINSALDNSAPLISYSGSVLINRKKTSCISLLFFLFSLKYFFSPFRFFSKFDDVHTLAAFWLDFF